MSVAHTLRNSGYVRANLPVDAEILAQVMNDFRYFTEHPPHGPWSFDSPIQQGDGGFTIKTGKEGSDCKTFFHYRPLLRDQLSMHNPAALNHPRVRHFLKLAGAIEKVCRQHALTFLRELEAELPGNPRLANRVKSNPWSALRLVAYTGVRAESTDLLAREHTDRAVLTLALCESGPGFEIKRPGSDDWEHLPLETGHMIVFAGDGLETLSGQTIPALRHRARHLDRSACLQGSILRSAAVYFAYAANVT